MSAKLLRVKQVQNQLSETQIQLNELINENRILKNLQKRQEGALKRYEGNHAELPQLIRSHNEEVRTLKASNKSIKVQLKECYGKLKERENELEALRESHNKLKKLSNNKNLPEREKLQKKLDELREIVREQEDKIQLLSRKILLESKTYRHRLNVEINKHKETQRELNNALSMISRLENQMATKGKSNCIGSGSVKLQAKHEARTPIPTIPSKSPVRRFDSTHREDILGEYSSDSKFETTDTPETDFEFSNDLDSSNDVCGTIRDVLPKISVPRRGSLENSLNGGISLMKGASITGTFQLTKKTSRSFLDVEANAKSVAQKLTRALECFDNVEGGRSVLVDSIERPVEPHRGSGLSAPKMEDKQKTKADVEVVDVREKHEIGNLRKNVPKRKHGEEKTNGIAEAPNGQPEEMSPGRREKLITMTKTWNEIRGKVREERMTAERKMKEAGEVDNGTLEELGFHRQKTAEGGVPPATARRTAKPMTEVVGDRVDQKRPSDNNELDYSYRTESRATHELLDGFHIDLQKRNLLRAMEAIDAENEGNFSSEEAEESVRAVRHSHTLGISGIPVPSPFPSRKMPKDEFLQDLFGPGEEVIFDREPADRIKARND